MAEKGGGVGRFLVRTFVVLLVLGLLGAISYLMSDINSRRYRLVQKEQTVFVEKGRFLPWGFAPFTPEIEALVEAYAPIRLWEESASIDEEIFEVRSDLDRAICSILSGLARKALDSETRDELELATGYIDQSALLPGVSEQQRLELRTLRADLAYKKGKMYATEILALMRAALEEFRLAQKLGTSRETDVEEQIRYLQKRIHSYSQADIPSEPNTLQDTPLSAETAPKPLAPKPTEPPPTEKPSPQPNETPDKTRDRWRL